MRTVRVIRVEADSTKQIREDADAFVVPAILTRESILPFGDGRGYRPAKELEAAAWTLEGAWVVAYNHVDTVFVTNPTDIRGRVENVKFDGKINGVTGDIRFLKARCDEAFLGEVKQGNLKDVSVAYFCEDVFAPGKFGDEPYDFVQENFMFGHVAAGVPEGRCPSPFCGMAVDSLFAKAHNDPEETANFIHIPIRDKTLFVDGSDRTIILSNDEGIEAVIGKLKSDPEGKTHIQKYMFAKAKGWTMEKAQAWVAQHKDSMDAEWSTVYVDNLPDDCFAYIEGGGKKDGEGKTVPRSLRHLEYKNAQGQIDRDHLVAALAALGGAHTGSPPSYAAEAKPKLCAAVHSWNSAHPDDKIQSAICGTDSQGDSCSLDSGLVLARSRELLGNMPKGRKDVMTDAGWGVRHHDGAL